MNDKKTTQIPTWHPAEMSSSAPSIYIGGGHSGVLHNKAMLKGLIIRISGDRVPRRCATAAVRRRYHLLHSRLRVGGPHPMHHDGNFLQFLRSPSEQGQIHFRGIRVIDDRDDPLCGHSGDADPCAPHTVLGYSIVREAAPSSRLATGAGHGGYTIKGLAGAASVARGTPSSGEGGPICHFDLFHVGVSNACWGATAIGRDNSAFLLERSGAIGDERSSCCLDYGLSTSISERAGDMSHSTHQHSPTCQVGIPCDAGIGGHSLAGDQRGLRAVTELG